MYRVVNLAVVRARGRLFSVESDGAQVAREGGMGKERLMTCRLVDDVRCRRVREMSAGANVRSDRQKPPSLKRLERARRNETVDTHGLKPGVAESLVHALDTRDLLGGDPDCSKASGIGGMCCLQESRVRLQHNEAPDGLIFGVVRRVILRNDELSKVGRQLR